MPSPTVRLEQAKRDIAALIKEVMKLEHLRDNRIVEDIAKRYRIDRFKP